MLRKLLTLLAVISGLTLIAEPARALDADIVSMAQAASANADCVVTVGRPLEDHLQRVISATSERPCKRVIVRTWTPTVQLQADRARE